MKYRRDYGNFVKWYALADKTMESIKPMFKDDKIYFKRLMD
ncbi:MAG: hypothetical protein AB9856_08010 [Cellulosilyticaceae bacterium]